MRRFSHTSPMQKRGNKPFPRFCIGLVCLCCVLFANVASADEPPLKNRPSNFSGAVGTFHISMDAQPTKLVADDPFTLTLRITADAPFDAPPKRPDLRTVTSFAQRFHIEPLPDKPSNGPTWEFVFRLRPRSAAVDGVPSLPLVYYKPSKAANGRGSYQTAYADPIPITIKPKEATTLPDESPPLRVPASAFTLVEGQAVLTRPWTLSLPEPLLLVLALISPPALCMGWFLIWRRLYPVATKLTRQRQSRAAKLALQGLHRCHRLPETEQVERAGTIVISYLRQRLELTTAEPTPDETATPLRQVGCPQELVDRTTRFFHDRDRACFAGLDEESRPWAEEAEVLIHDMEMALDKVSSEARDNPRAEQVIVGGVMLAVVASYVCGSGCLSQAAFSRAVEDGLLATEGEKSFQQGLEHKDDPKSAHQFFRQSADCYQQLCQRGYSSPGLYQNLGNAHLLSGDLPHAILAYRRGLDTFPHDGTLREHLDEARGLVAYPDLTRLGQPVDERVPLWAMLVPPGLVMFASLAMYALGWAAVTRWLMVRRRSLLIIAPICFVAGGLLAWLWWGYEGERRVDLAHPVLVVTDDGVLVRKGNGLGYPPRYETPVNRGVEARLLVERGDWVKIQLAGGETGWVLHEYVAY